MQNIWVRTSKVSVKRRRKEKPEGRENRLPEQDTDQLTIHVPQVEEDRVLFLYVCTSWADSMDRILVLVEDRGLYV